MTKKHIITIGGRPGSGKSTTAKLVAAGLSFKHFSSGDLFRAIGKERGIDVLQTNLTAEQNAEVDNMVDGRLQEMGAKDDQLVIDSRMAWHWMPNSFKVFLDLDLTTAAERILAGIDEARLANEHIDNDPAAYALTLQQRLDSESRRYKNLYNVDLYDLSQYDLVIDTAANDIEATVKQVVDAYKKWLEQ